MALRVPLSSPPPHFHTTTRNISPLVIVNSSSSNSKQQKLNQEKRIDLASVSTPYKTPVPFLTASEIASSINHDITISTLERLFSSTSSSGSLPPIHDTVHHIRRRPPVRVAYQGVRGSYCQEATALAFSSLPITTFPCGSGLESPFSALENGDADRAVVPVENSFDGPIPRNLDLLIRHSDSVKIVGEIVLPVNHCLLCLPAVDPSSIRRVVSHPQALSHCQQRLRSMDLDSVEEVHSAADFAKFVAENKIADTAVIGSEIAAREFGLAVLHRNFQDRPGNYNRFLQLGLGSQPTPPGTLGNPKTTIAFTLEKGATDLFKAMWAFECRGVKVTHVDHRPNRENPIRVVEGRTGSGVRYFDYVFILDVEGSESEMAVRKAIDRLKEITGFVRVLGSYAACEPTSL